jgi:hypothetical protein
MVPFVTALVRLVQPIEREGQSLLAYVLALVLLAIVVIVADLAPMRPV